jgi:hypothetical protein
MRESKTNIALGAAVCALLVEVALGDIAGTPVSTGPPIVKQYRAAPAQKIVLHGVHFRTGEKIDEPSLAVLDSAVAIIKDNPNSLIYVTAHHPPHEVNAVVSKRIHRQTRAVTAYLEQRGISADKLIVVPLDSEPHAFTGSHAQGSQATPIIVQIDLPVALD